jgi:hypothetical protein
MRITPATTEVLRAFWKVVEPNLTAILDGFYQHVASEPHLRQLVGDNTARLKRAQTSHWQRLFGQLRCRLLRQRARHRPRAS